MGFDRNLTIRIDNALTRRLGLVLNDVSDRRRRDRSRLVRQMISKDSTLWLDSPYIGTQTRIFFLVRGNGDIYYHNIQDLKLRSERAKIPASMNMKQEKLEQFLQEGVTTVRAHWILNYFAVSLKDDQETQLVSGTDRRGVSSKTVDMVIDQALGTDIRRETLGGIHDYVQRRSRNDDHDRTRDRGETTIAFPMLDYQINIMVDLNLFKESPDLYKSASLDYEFRNLEAARFSLKRLDSPDNPLSWIEDRYPFERYQDQVSQEALKATRAAFSRFRTRVRELADLRHEEDGLPLVKDSQDVAELKRLEEPESFLFGQLNWAMPHPGIVTCVTWNKPLEQKSKSVRPIRGR